MRLDKTSYYELLSKAFSYYRKKKFRNAAHYCALAAEIARHEEKLNDEVITTWVEASCWEQLEQYETALVKYTWIISKIEDESVHDHIDSSTISTVIRSFCDWVGCAAEIPSFDNENLMDVFDAGEKHLWSSGSQQDRPEFLHSKSIALMLLYQFETALIVAEEGLALKKVNPSSSGCGLRHHLEVYAETLSLLDQTDEALDVLDEAIAKYPGESSCWADRGMLNVRLRNYSNAISDFTESIFILNNAGRYRGRGLAYALSGDTPAALGDFRKALQEDRQDLYSALWLAGLGKLYSRLRAVANVDLWIANAAKFYLGELSKDELLEIADKTGSGRTKKKYLCKSHTFVGLFHEGQGDLNLARHHYESSVATHAVREDEYIWARARLEQLRS